MLSPKGRFAAVLLPALLALPPSPASAQCQGHQMNSTQQMSQMPQMSQMFSTRLQLPQMSSIQSQRLQWFAMQQMQMLAMQQTQLVALQRQIQALQQMEMIAALQQPGPIQQPQWTPGQPGFPFAPQSQLSHAQRKQYGELLKEMDALQQRLTDLEQAVQRNEGQPSQLAAAQRDANALQQKVDALSRPPQAVLERMDSLHRQADDLVQQMTARPADLIASVRNPH
jgi:hypothetical protein